MLAIYLWAAVFACTVLILFWALKQVLPVRLASRDTQANEAYFLFDSARLVKASRAGRQLLAATEDGAKGWAGGSKRGGRPRIGAVRSITLPVVMPAFQAAVE